MRQRKGRSGRKSPQDGGGVFLTVHEVAQALDLSDARTYALIANGAIPHVRSLGRIRIPRAAFDRWLVLEADRAIASLRDGKAAS